METKRLSASERDAMLRLAAATAIIGTEPDKLAKRLEIADLPYIKRDIGMIRSKIQKILGELTKTIPENQLQSFKKMLHTATYSVGVQNPLKEFNNDKDYYIWLSYATVYELVAGCHNTCLMCDLDKQGRKSCPLRKTLDTIPNDTPDRPDGDCPYYGVV